MNHLFNPPLPDYNIVRLQKKKYRSKAELLALAQAKKTLDQAWEPIVTKVNEIVSTAGAEGLVQAHQAGLLEVEVYDKGGKARSLSAWIEVRTPSVTERRRSVPYPDYRANGNLAAVFGLGAAGHAEVRVRWPGGEATGWQRVEAGETARVVRP